MTQAGWDPRGKVYSIVSADKGWELATDVTPSNGTLKTIKGAIYSIAPNRKAVTFSAPGTKPTTFPLPDLLQPSSVALSPDQAMLIVTDSGSRYQWSYQIAADGSLQNGEPFYRLELPESGPISGATSVIEDAIGQVYFATPLGIQVCEANGRVAAILNSPAGHYPVTAIAWGGKDLDWIYAAANGRLYRRPVKVKGTASWALVKLPQPPL
jgi:sugar lactone lactonase YvrE